MSSVNEWISKMWYTPTIKYYTVAKRNELDQKSYQHLSERIKLQYNISSKHILCNSMFICIIWNYFNKIKKCTVQYFTAYRDIKVCKYYLKHEY